MEKIDDLVAHVGDKLAWGEHANKQKELAKKLSHPGFGWINSGFFISFFLAMPLLALVCGYLLISKYLQWGFVSCFLVALAWAVMIFITNVVAYRKLMDRVLQLSDEVYRPKLPRALATLIKF